MTVSNQTPYIEYTANGSTTSFALPFDCDNANNLIVKINNVEAVGTWTLQGSTVVFITAPIANSIVSIERNTPLERTTNYQTYDDSFSPKPVNKDFDRIWHKLQELGYRDQVIWLALLKEISDRILGDNNLQNQIDLLEQQVDLNSQDIAQLVNDLSKEIADRIANDLALKTMFLSMMDEAINQGTVNALAITHVNSIKELEEIANVWDGRTIYVKDVGNYSYNATTKEWGKVLTTNKWEQRSSGYSVGELVILDDGTPVISTIINNIVDPNNNINNWKYAGKSFVTDDYTTLSQTLANNGQIAFVKADGIAGEFRYNSTSTVAENGGTIIASTHGGNWLRIFSGAVNISWFDLKLNNTDETKKLQAATNLGVGVYFSSTMTITITDTIKVLLSQHWEASAEVVIQYKAPGGTKIKPMVDATAKFTTSENFVFDHNSDSGQGGYLPNDVYGGNPIAGSAILLQADNCSMTKPVVRNAFDNGIAIVQLDPVTNLAVPSKPVGVSITGARTYYCGFGTKAGAGIDNASGISNIVDAQDTGSYTGFINDIGAGARGVWSNLVSLWARRDGNSEQSGYGLYSGSPDSSFTNVTVIGAGNKSFWLDRPATNSRYVNLLSDAPQEDALKIKGGQCQIIGFTAKNTGQAATNTHTDILFDSTAGDITDVVISNVVSDGQTSAYVISCQGAGDVRGAVLGLSGTGATETLNLNGKHLSVLYADANTGFLSFNKAGAGVPFDFYGRMRIGAEKANASSTVDAFGDTNGNGTFIIEDFATPEKRMAMGYDPVNDFFAMQSMHVNTMKKPLILNPAGGDVGMTTGAWNTGCVRMGNYRLWIDVSGRLRIKNGSPLSDTDGSIVGTQS